MVAVYQALTVKIHGTSVDSEYLSTTLTGLDTNSNVTKVQEFTTADANPYTVTTISTDIVTTV